LGRLFAGATLACLALMIPARSAQATFHLVSISEVYPGSAAQPQSSFLELEEYDKEQNLVYNHSVVLYNATGGVTGTFTFPSDLPGIGANQQTMLVGDDGVQAAFGVTPDLVDPNFNLPAAGGAACWEGLDCVAWGNFSGTTTPTSGVPADPPGIPNGKALARRINGGSCGNLLDEDDDTNDSDGDFTEATPTPQSYATVPVPPDCVPPPPTLSTLIDTKPATVTSSPEASFTFHASSTPTGFECRLDLGAYADCSPGSVTYLGPLSEATHRFRVRALNANGAGPPTTYNWTVDHTPPTAKINTHPAERSPGKSASFGYGSSDGGTKFECRLNPVEAAFSLCGAQPKTYLNLADGKYEFEIRAIDAAGNVQAEATSFAWTVDNSLIDTTPPETTIVSRPPDPTTSPAASFTYASNEPGSSFECKLDGGFFGTCPSTGIAYTGLTEGAHTFQVRAKDASGNADPTPAGYSFQVVLSGPSPPLGGTPLPAPKRKAAKAAPNTTIAKQGTRFHDRTPTFRFSSDKGGASFQCRLDGGPYLRCHSPFTTKKLGYGSHLLRVRAVLDGAGDPSPAKLSFKIVKG
jgi:hypothetical protein